MNIVRKYTPAIIVLIFHMNRLEITGTSIEMDKGIGLIEHLKHDDFFNSFLTLYSIKRQQLPRMINHMIKTQAQYFFLRMNSPSEADAAHACGLDGFAVVFAVADK